MRIVVPLLLLSVATAQNAGDKLVPIGVVKHPPVDEISGIVKSRTYPNVWWVHNDSGDSARIFAIDGKGNQVFPGWLKDRYWAEQAQKPAKEPWPGFKIHLAANLDWEDIAIDDGKLYIAAMGNNGNNRRDLGVYVLNEPYPGGLPETRILKFLPIRYPDQHQVPAKKWHFDCESLFVSNGKLYFLTKHRVAGQFDRGELGTKLYRLDTAHTDRENVLELVDARGDLAMPTAADLSPDGTKLAVLTVRALWIFPKPKEGDAWLTGGKAQRLLFDPRKAKQVEAVCWDDAATLRVVNEQRDIFAVKLPK